MDGASSPRVYRRDASARIRGSKGQLTRDSVIYGVGGSATQLVYILFVPVFTRIFRPSDFGVLESLVALNSLLGVAALLGLNSAIFYFLKQTDDPDRRRHLAGTALSVAVTAGVVVALVGVLGSGALSQVLLQQPGYGVALAMACLWVPANVAATLALDFLRLDFRARAYSTIGIARGLIASALGVILAGPAGLGVAGLLAAQAITTIVAAVVALAAARNTWTPALKADAAKSMLAFGLPLATFGVALWVIAFSDRFFVIQFLGTAAAGIYSLAGRGAGVVSLVLFAFEAAWLPFAMDRAQEPGHRQVYARTFLAVGVGLVALATFLSLFAREALFVLATPDYLPAYSYVGMLALAVAVYGMGQVVGVGIQLGQRTRHLIWISGAGASVNVALNLALIPRFGIPGAAAATLGAYVVSTALVFVVAQRAYPVSYPLRSIWVATAVGATAMLIGLALDAQSPPGVWQPTTTAAKGLVWIVAARLLWLVYRRRQRPVGTRGVAW